MDSRMGASMDRTGGEMDRGTRNSMVMGMSSFGMEEQSDNTGRSIGGGTEEIGRSRGMRMNNSEGSSRGSNIINSMEHEKVREKSGSFERWGEGIDRSGMGSRRRMSSCGLGGQSNSMGGGFVSSNQSGEVYEGGSKGVKRSDSIIVRNLALDCNWHTLESRFSHAGDIKYAEMKDRGVGIIRFGSERDAERAVSMMNQQRIDGRSINVSLY